MTGEQIISMETIPYYTDGRKKPLWRVNYTYLSVYHTEVNEKHGYVYIDNPTLRRLERFKIERHKFTYLAEIINRVNE
jgi:hypothetical protein